MKHKVYISKLDGHLEAKLLDGLQAIHWEKIIKPSMTVLIKPNFTYPEHLPGVTTTPELLYKLVNIVEKRADRVIVAESDGGNNSFTADEAWKNHSHYYNTVFFRNLSKLPRKTYKGEGVSIELSDLDFVDVIINVPVMKVHAMTTVSLGLKNLWGMVPDTMRGMHHQDIHKKLTLIARVMNPAITIIDGTYALDEHGPMYGKARETDVLIVSDNVVAADDTAARMMGFNASKIKHIDYAVKAGLGNPNRISFYGTLPQIPRFHLKRSLIDYLSLPVFHSDLLAKLVFQSPLTKALYKVIPHLRNKQEKQLTKRMYG